MSLIGNIKNFLPSSEITPTKASLVIDGKEYELIHCTYRFGRIISHKGVPTTKIHAGIITLMFRDPANEHLLRWMAGPHVSKDGQIRFYSNQTDFMTTQSLSFKNGFCAESKNEFSRGGGGGGSLTTTITLSVENMQIGSVTHDNDWENQ